MMKIRKGRSFQIVAFMPYRFYMDESGVTVRNERGRKIGTFATEKEAVEYLKGTGEFAEGERNAV